MGDVDLEPLTQILHQAKNTGPQNTQKMSDKCKEAVGDDNDAWDGRRSVCLPLYTVSGDVRFTEYEEKDTAGYY
jgi:hypothetical protein